MIFLIALIAAVLILGQSRTGKTSGLIPQILNGVGKRPKLIIDPQRSLSRMAILHLAYHGLTRFVRFIRLADWRRCFGFLNLKPSNSPNALLRRQENHERVMEVVQILMSRRGLNPVTSPLIHEWAYAGLKLVMHSRSPLYWLPYAYLPDSRQYLQMIHRCDDPETKQKMLQVFYFSHTQRRNECAPALRLCEFMAYDLAFILLCGPLDFEELLLRNLVLIFEGAEANEETARTSLITVIAKGIQFVKQFARPLEVHIDEWNSWDLLAPSFAVSIASLQKLGWLPFLSGQHLKGDEDTIKAVVENSQIKRFYRLGDMESIRFAAAMISTGTLDPTRVLRRERRSRGLDTELVDVYENFSDQEKSTAKEIMQLPPGAFFRCAHGHVDLVHPPKLKEPWSCWKGLAEEKTEQAIEEILSSPEYSIPTIITPETNLPPIRRNGSKEQKQKQAAPKSGKQGMRKSSRGKKRTRAR